MTPEQKSRGEIDDQLHQTGWAVQSADEMDITAARGVAVREFPLETGFADCLHNADCEALGTTDVLAQEIANDIETALEQFSAVTEGMKG